MDLNVPLELFETLSLILVTEISPLYCKGRREISEKKKKKVCYSMLPNLLVLRIT